MLVSKTWISLLPLLWWLDIISITLALSRTNLDRQDYMGWRGWSRYALTHSIVHRCLRGNGNNQNVCVKHQAALVALKKPTFIPSSFINNANCAKLNLRSKDIAVHANYTTKSYAGSSFASTMTLLRAGDGYGGSGLNWSPASSNSSIIFMHGLGDTADGWSGLVNVLEGNLQDNVRLILPTAPVRPVTLMMGSPVPAWSDIYGLDINAAEDYKGLSESVSRIRSIIRGEIARGIAPERIIVGGFSQGGALAYISALGGLFDGSDTSNIPAVGGVLSLSCWWPLRQMTNLNENVTKAVPHVLHCHGTDDDLVPSSFGIYSIEYLRKLMKESGSPVASVDERFVLKLYPQMGHSTCPQQMKDILNFIKARLNK